MVSLLWVIFSLEIPNRFWLMGATTDGVYQVIAGSGPSSSVLMMRSLKGTTHQGPWEPTEYQTCVSSMYGFRYLS